VHWIQAKKSWEEPGVVQAGTVIEVGVGLLRVLVEGEIRVYRNHDTPRFLAIARRYGRDVEVQERWHLLKVPHPEGKWCFCIGLATDEWVPCRDRGEADAIER
jgi:hypothetical protein